MKKILYVLSLLIVTGTAYAVVPGFNSDTYGNIGVVPPATILVSSTGFGPTTSSATAVTAGGTLMYNYITHIHIEQVSTGTVSAVTAMTVCTSSNMPSTPTFMLPTNQTGGTANYIDISLDNPMKSVTPNNVTSITCPVAAGAKYNILLNYYQDN